MEFAAGRGWPAGCLDGLDFFFFFLLKCGGGGLINAGMISPAGAYSLALLAGDVHWLAVKLDAFSGPLIGIVSVNFGDLVSEGAG